MMIRTCGLILTLVAGCGGANLNRRAAGNRDGGIELERREIAVDPRGERVLVRSGDGVLVGELATLRLEPVHGVDAPRLLAFWAGRERAGFFALAATSLASYDLAARRVVWRRALPGAAQLAMRPGARAVAWKRLDVSADGRRVILAAGRDVLLIDAASGAEVGRFTAAHTVEDLDISPDGGRVIVTENERWQGDRPETAVHVLASADGARLCTAVVPNCADELVVEPGGERAFLAPTICRKDPVSIVDITASCRFEQNLPGFGPIALSPDGGTGVAFLDRDVADPGAPALPPGVKDSDSRYHLMFFDLRTLALRTVAVGDDRPRYAITPDGAHLLIDGARLVMRERELEDIELLPVRILDLPDGVLRTADGPEVLLQAFVLAPDSQHAWLIHPDRDGEPRLYELDIAAARVTAIDLPFRPLTLNTTPAGDVLILRAEDGVHLYDVARREVTATFRPGP